MMASSSFVTKHGDGSPPPPFTICEKPLSSLSSDKKWNHHFVKRQKVKQALVIFRKLFTDLFTDLLSEYRADQYVHVKATLQALTKAATLMKNNHQCENTAKMLGHVPGIEVGDQFQYRSELIVIGLHCQSSCGIDFMGKGRNSLATSIVVTDRYANTRKSSGSLVYIGSGGNPRVRNVNPRDQKLEGGNLALKNSMEAKTPVRVIFKICINSNGMGSYIYDGLYLVEKMTQERGKFGKLVFKFTMNRILEQPSTCIASKNVVVVKGNNARQFARFLQRKSKRSKTCIAHKDVVCVNDISKGEEKFAIRVVASTDSDYRGPPSFDYIVNNIYPKKFLKQAMLYGCDCIDGCVDCEKCACIVKNGGTMPYDGNKRLASHMASSIIYECGPSCKCSSSCINGVTQFGIQFQLEIFKTENMGWGVRTRSFIPSGSFVCEYIGEICHYGDVGSRLDDDDDNYIFNLGVGNGFIDATRHGNIGRFINHSCSPNLHVKDVMYDHNDKRFPHKMLFALKDIPAGRELWYDYNCSKGGISKVRTKRCNCGSKECIGII